MKYYGEKSLSNFLTILLDIVLVVGCIVFIWISKNELSASSFSLQPFQKVFTYFLYLIGSISLICILYHLKLLMKSLVLANPFVKENVQILRNISIQCFTIAVCYLLNLLVNRQYINFRLLFIDASGAHTDLEFFIFFFAACFIFILSKVFEQAVEVKEENDFTI